MRQDVVWSNESPHCYPTTYTNAQPTPDRELRANGTVEFSNRIERSKRSRGPKHE